jgi:hypothetical protein
VVEGSDSAFDYHMFTEGEEVVTSWYSLISQNNVHPQHAQRLDEVGDVVWPTGGVQPLTSGGYPDPAICAWVPGEALFFANLPGGFAVRRIAHDGEMAFSPVILSDTSLWFRVVLQESGVIPLDAGSDIGVFRLTAADLVGAVDPKDYPFTAPSSRRLCVQASRPMPNGPHWIGNAASAATIQKPGE